MGGRSWTPGTEAATRPLVEGPVADDDVGHPGLDGHRGLLDGGARRAAAVVDAAEEGEIADPEARAISISGLVSDGEGDHAADLVPARSRRPAAPCPPPPWPGAARSDPTPWKTRWRRSRRWRPCRQRSRFIGTSRCRPARGNATITVPVTWLPSPFAPWMVTSTAPGSRRPRALLGGDRPRERHRVVGVVGRAEADRRSSRGPRPGPTSR